MSPRVGSGARLGKLTRERSPAKEREMQEHRLGRREEKE